MRDCVVASASSEDADRYLDEATRCYFFGLFTACAVMCRSVLEEAIKQKLPESLARLVRTRYRNAATLGNLLHEVNNNLQMTGIDGDFPHIANQVNDAGKKAVHQGLPSGLGGLPVLYTAHCFRREQGAVPERWELQRHGDREQFTGRPRSIYALSRSNAL